MEKSNIPYETWPEWMKLMTAFRIRSITIKEPKAVSGLSMINIVVGLVILIPALIYGERLADVEGGYNFDFWSIYIALLNLIIGLFNFFVTKNAIAWIRDNSSWEERDEHKSDGKYKFQYVLIMLGIFVLPWLIACLICC